MAEKTLGQVAKETWDAYGMDDPTVTTEGEAFLDECWQAAALAVRRETLEEAARYVEALRVGSTLKPQYWPDEIRALKNQEPFNG